MDRKPVIGKQREHAIRANYPLLWKQSVYYKMKQNRLSSPLIQYGKEISSKSLNFFPQDE